MNNSVEWVKENETVAGLVVLGCLDDGPCEGGGGGGGQ
jgi:hypothetical protein